MDYDGRVVFKIDGDDSGLKKAINGAETSLGGLKSTLVKLGLGALFTKGMKDAVTATNKFESSLAKASTLFGSVSVDTENLSKKIIELSTATGQTAESIGNSLYNALSAGIPVTEDMGDAMTFLESATKLSVAGFTDVDTAVTATAKVLNAYGMSMEEAGRVGEILMETQNLGITTVNELGGALATVTPIASSFGVAFEQVGASLAVMTKQGTDTATATTQLRGLIAELGQDGTQASKNLQKAFQRAGLEYRNFAEYMRDPNNNLQGAIKLLKDEADLAGLSLSDMFSNVRAGMGALQLAQDEMGVFHTFMTDMASDSQLVNDAYSKMMDTRANKWKRMREQLKNITISITNSDAVQNILDNITRTAQNFLDKVDGWLPNILNKLDIFYQKARVVITLLKKNYEGSFLEKGITFAIEITKNGLQDIIDKFKDGNIFGAVAELVGDYFLLKFSFKLLAGALSNLSAGMTAGTAFGGALGVFAADALILYVGFQQVQSGEHSMAQFGTQVALSLATALGVMCLSANPAVAGLVFGVTFKVLGWIWDEDEREPRVGNAPTGSTEDTHGGITINNTGTAGQIAKYLKKTVFGDNSELYKQVRDSGEEIGKYLAEGVSQGLISEEVYTKYAVYSYADLLNEMMQEAEEIHSPSKVWEKYGEYLAQGLALGLSGNDAEQYARNSVNEIYDWLNDEVAKGNMTAQEAWQDIDFINDENLKGQMAGELDAYAKKLAEWKAVAMSAYERKQPTSGGKTTEKETPSALSEIATTLSTDVHKGWETFMEDITNAEARAGRFKDAFGEAFDLLTSSFETFGESIAEGEADWTIFAKAGLEAIATLLEAIGKELSVIAIEALVAENYPKAILAGAGSATALVTAGIVRGYSNSFERGGIVGGSGITGDRHVIYANAGELILSKAQQGAIASQLSGRNSPNITIAFNGQVFGDQEAISSYVYDGIRNAQREGGLPAW